MTLNGKIAQQQEQSSTDWTSRADKELFVKITKKAGVIIMGSKTFDTIGKPLPDRLNIIMTGDPKSKQSTPNLLEFTNETPKEIIKMLEKRGFEEAVVCGGSHIYTQFLQEHLINKICVTIEPIIFGDGVPLVQPSNFSCRLRLEDVTKTSDSTIFLTYTCLY